ncbi:MULTISPECIES: hypothetical protein [unclassified Corynebacterium]|uniref:hypothetical protein n=1 Tax=unclassified Corynebacterium TaxID=2624378 RepID=UPI0021AA251E|nr:MULTISPECIES: hypothetical protein [unclassified Corynebacterium]MCT1451989.1 hypothetical protein [Corynebacterium sp. p3-SID1145]MCT1461036.1 hypothetical protein [Corynebacterium sp. p3-SID1140]MDN8594994.1 hypothetical protein [Corynebacterium sp. P4_F2]WKK54783.1 hypothetical protein QYR03_05930 [Corynebacterium sp. P4-C1]WKK64160.1 hypothetical protein QYR04_04550 [Corynebacterium sp. P8-C1]
MTLDVSTRLNLGGITENAADNSVPLVAAAYTHPVLAGRSIVQLIPEPLAEADELALGVIGLEPAGRVNVGHTRRRAIGFPEWPILNDPENAHHALNLVADMERAGKYAASKPKKFKGAVDELGDKLDNSAPHFLPTFFEEAGRVFIAADNGKLAAQMFTQARDAERRHSLPIDEIRHAEAVLEFAYAGALSTKELGNEAKRLAEQLEPEEAYRAYRTLCVERVRGGLSPHAGMKKELAKLAKAAGLDTAKEEDGVVRDLLSVPSMKKAGAHFWKNYEKAICRVVADDPALMDQLLSLFPRHVDTDPWLHLLDITGALDVVKDGAHPDFVPGLLLFESQWTKWPYTPSTQLTPVLADILPHAGLSTVTVPKDRLHYLPAAAVEQVLANGLTFSFSHAPVQTDIDLTRWARLPERAPLPHLMADESLRGAVVLGIKNAMRHPEVVETLTADPHVRTLVVELLTEIVDKLEAGVPSVDHLTQATTFVRGFELVGDEEIQSLLDRVRVIHRDPAVPLAESLRRGLPDELGWPELEQLNWKYGEPMRLNLWLTAEDCWPGVIVEADSRTTYLRGRNATAIPNWTGQKLFGAMEVDGQFGLATYTNANPRVWWESAPEGMTSRWRELPSLGLVASVPVPGGRIFDADTVMRPGHSTWASGSQHFFVDGNRVWLIDSPGLDDGSTVVELDPATGATGRESLPDWFAEQCRRHPDLVFEPQRSQHRPVEDTTAESLFSTADGFHRHAVFTRPDDPDFCLVVDADGTEFTVTGKHARKVTGVLQRPNGGRWILTNEHIDPVVLDPEDMTPVAVRGTQLHSHMWWHHFRVREPETSEMLRQITADEVRPLVNRARENGNGGADKHMCELVGEVLGVDDPVLRYAIASAAHQAATSWPQEDTDARAEELTGAPTFAEHHGVLRSLTRFPLAKFDAMDIWQGAAALGMHNRYVPEKGYTHNRTRGSNDWMKLLGHGDALVIFAASPGRTADEVQALKELWTVLRDAGALTADNLVLESYASVPFSPGQNVQLPPQAVRLARNVSGDPLIVRVAGAEMMTVNGTPLKLNSRTDIAPSRTDLEPVFDALLARIAEDGPLPYSASTGEAFAAAANSPLADAHVIAAGFPNLYSFDANFVPKDLRSAMGLKVNELKAARERLMPSGDHFAAVLAAGLPDNAAELLTSGPDIASMAKYWLEHGPDYLPEIPGQIAERVPKVLKESVLQSIVAGRHFDADNGTDNADDWAQEVGALIWLATELDMTDPLRPALADHAERLHSSPRGIDAIKVAITGIGEDDEAVRSAIGAPKRAEGDTDRTDLQAGRFTLEQHYDWDLVLVDLSDVDEPCSDLDLAREWAKDLHNGASSRLRVAAADVRARGVLTSYAEWLREPGKGEPRDPLVSAPELVAEAADALGVSQDAARYYLQLLAWPEPTDKNVRRWNTWKKADIVRAGSELVAAGKVVEGKRPRSGRSYFLPGGWVEKVHKSEGQLPVEVWKLPAFGIEQSGYNGEFEPQLGIAVAPLPPPEWFATCWERSQGDDAPQFAELETTRRRRR